MQKHSSPRPVYCKTRRGPDPQNPPKLAARNPRQCPGNLPHRVAAGKIPKKNKNNQKFSLATSERARQGWTLLTHSNRGRITLPALPPQTTRRTGAGGQSNRVRKSHKQKKKIQARVCHRSPALPTIAQQSGRLVLHRYTRHRTPQAKDPGQHQADTSPEHNKKSRFFPSCLPASPLATALCSDRQPTTDHRLFVERGQATKRLPSRGQRSAQVSTNRTAPQNYLRPAASSPPVPHPPTHPPGQPCKREQTLEVRAPSLSRCGRWKPTESGRA